MGVRAVDRVVIGIFLLAGCGGGPEQEAATESAASACSPGATFCVSIIGYETLSVADRAMIQSLFDAWVSQESYALSQALTAELNRSYVQVIYGVLLTAIVEAVKDLESHPRCAALLDGGPGSTPPLDVLKQKLSAGLIYPVFEFGADGVLLMKRDCNGTSCTNAANVSTGAIEIYGSYLDQSVQAQVKTILHEIGHATGSWIANWHSSPSIPLQLPSIRIGGVEMARPAVWINDPMIFPNTNAYNALIFAECQPWGRSNP